MIESANAFLRSVNEKAHLLQLFNKINFLKISLVSENENVYFALTNGKIELLNSNIEHVSSYEITGDLQAIIDLLEGKEKLRSLILSGRLETSASFRTTLLLESLFFLAKAEKIIS
ncbi:MAG: SCP2 sterol-binding domain-containing protein [Bacillota bacterium]|nr:SCP2 sterol-binding domain-containing protein [Bacillota bacterium]